MSARAGDPSASGASERDAASHRDRHRKRKRHKPRIVVRSWRWWHLVGAIAVALLAGVLTILLLRGSDSGVG